MHLRNHATMGVIRRMMTVAAVAWGIGLVAVPAARAQAPTSAPAKHWVWLTKQGCWGFGYQRADGFWVIDPGSKRLPAAPVAAAPATGGHEGFLGWLNATRAQAGLPAVGFDPQLANWAAVNNARQQAWGMGHFVMGPARRQNCAMGDAASIGGMWMNSPAHRAALLDPSIRWIGLAGLGAYWTFNAY